jgi:hypothetical protein
MGWLQREVPKVRKGSPREGDLWSILHHLTLILGVFQESWPASTWEATSESLLPAFPWAP